MESKLKRIVNQTFTCLLLVVAMSCTGNKIKTNNMEVVVSKDGVITNIRMSNGKQLDSISLSTDLVGFKIDGKVISKNNSDGSIEYKRRLVCDSLNTSCTIVEHYIPTKNSIRCEVKIQGNDLAFNTSVQTKLKYPIKNGKTKIWSTWGAPQFNAKKIEKNLGHSLRRIGVPNQTLGNKDILYSIDPNQEVYWIDPLVAVPFSNATYYYGAHPFEYENMRIGFIPFQENLISIPMVSILEDIDNSGMTIALSLQDNIIDLVMNTAEDGNIVFSRLHNRISKDNLLEFAFDLISHENDFRCGLDWMKNRYPEFFNPKNPLANEMGGTGAYSAYSAESMNFDIEKMKKMAFTVNWQASFDFPYMGMFLPPLQKHEKWKRFGDGPITISEMDNFARKYRENGFYVLNYFNVTEFGAHVKFPPPSDLIKIPDTELWQDCNALLYTKFKNAILPIPENSITDPKQKNSPIPVPFYTWEGGIAMDCGDPTYSGFLLEQAKRHIEEIPNSFGICIDRLDWVRMFNERENDSVSMFDGKPARSLVSSWKSIAPKLGALMHNSNKVIFVNNHSKRIDLLEHVDGIFDEFTYSGSTLNLTAFLCVAKPALGWVRDAEMIRSEGGDSFFQRYLYMGVFPMCPFPNNDHSITTSTDIDKYYIDYGPLMKLFKGREWVLKPNSIGVVGNFAKVNLFKVKGGYSVPIVYGEKNEIDVVLNNVEGLESEFQCKAYYPGNDQPKELNFEREGSKILIRVPLERGCAMLSLNTIQ